MSIDVENTGECDCDYGDEMEGQLCRGSTAYDQPLRSRPPARTYGSIGVVDVRLRMNLSTDSCSGTNPDTLHSLSGGIAAKYLDWNESST